MTESTLQALIVQDEIAHGLPLPGYGYPGDACRDIPTAARAVIPAFNGADVRTGLRLVPPPGYYFRVVGKGSSAFVGLFFALEIIDPTYRGEVILYPWNTSSKDVVVERGRSIAQLELLPITRYEWHKINADQLDKTERDKGRMDSTKTGILSQSN
ncbi:MAG: hypothetical protein AAB480_01535 [Patescibacteria group bacterium]